MPLPTKKNKIYNTLEKIPENLKCPVCFDLLLSPIYQCEIGHNICHSCIDNVHECPLCKGDYGDTRNYFAEDLVNSCTFPCKFEEFGCPGLFNGGQLKEHHNECVYRPYRCPELACKELIGLHQMGPHLEKHGFKVRFDYDLQFFWQKVYFPNSTSVFMKCMCEQVMKGDSLLATLEIQDTHFDKITEYNPWRISTINHREFFAVTSRQKDGYWYFWAWILAQPEEAKKYSVEIVLTGADKDVIYRGVVHSLRVAPEDVMKSGNCLIIGDGLIKSMRKENGNLSCGVRFIEGKNWNSKKAKGVGVAGAAGTQKTNAKLVKQTRKNIRKVAVSTIPGTISLARAQLRKISPFAPSPPPRIMGSSMTSKPSVPVTIANSDNQRPSTSANLFPRPTKSSILKPTPTSMSSRSKIITKNGKLLTTEQLQRPKTVGSAFPKSASSRPQKRTVTEVNAPTAKALPVVQEDSELIKNLKATLICPGCQQVILPPVFMCSIGHNICSLCKIKAIDCPLCRAPIGVARNFFAEELLYKAVQKCRFQPSGCQVCLPIAQIRLHENICHFAPFECPFNTCHQQFASKDLMEHLKLHQISIVQKEMSGAQISLPKIQPKAKAGETYCTIPNIIQLNSIGFYPTVTHEQVTGQWGFWVSSHEHHNYQCEIIIKKQSKTLVYHGPVVSLRMTQNEIKANGCCLLTNDRVLKAMKHPTNGVFELTVRVIFMDPRSIMPETFAIPSVYGKKALEGTTGERTKLFANPKTSRNDEDDDTDNDGDDEDESDVTIENIFNRVGRVIVRPGERDGEVEIVEPYALLSTANANSPNNRSSTSSFRQSPESVTNFETIIRQAATERTGNLLEETRKQAEVNRPSPSSPTYPTAPRNSLNDTTLPVADENPINAPATEIKPEIAEKINALITCLDENLHTAFDAGLSEQILEVERIIRAYHERLRKGAAGAGMKPLESGSQAKQELQELTACKNNSTSVEDLLKKAREKLHQKREEIYNRAAENILGFYSQQIAEKNNNNEQGISPEESSLSITEQQRQEFKRKMARDSNNNLVIGGDVESVEAKKIKGTINDTWQKGTYEIPLPSKSCLKVPSRTPSKSKLRVTFAEAEVTTSKAVEEPQDFQNSPSRIGHMSAEYSAVNTSGAFANIARIGNEKISWNAERGDLAEQKVSTRKQHKKKNKNKGKNNGGGSSTGQSKRRHQSTPVIVVGNTETGNSHNHVIERQPESTTNYTEATANILNTYAETTRMISPEDAKELLIVRNSTNFKFHKSSTEILGKGLNKRNDEDEQLLIDLDDNDSTVSRRRSYTNLTDTASVFDEDPASDDLLLASSSKVLQGISFLRGEENDDLASSLNLRGKSSKSLSIVDSSEEQIKIIRQNSSELANNISLRSLCIKSLNKFSHLSQPAPVSSVPVVPENVAESSLGCQVGNSLTGIREQNKQTNASAKEEDIDEDEVEKEEELDEDYHNEDDSSLLSISKSVAEGLVNTAKKIWNTLSSDDEDDDDDEYDDGGRKVVALLDNISENIAHYDGEADDEFDVDDPTSGRST